MNQFSTTLGDICNPGSLFFIISAALIVGGWARHTVLARRARLPLLRALNEDPINRFSLHQLRGVVSWWVMEAALDDLCVLGLVKDRDVPDYHMSPDMYQRWSITASGQDYLQRHTSDG